MKHILASLAFLLASPYAAATTLNPVQLLNPTGSAAGQAIVSTGAATAPAWGGIGLNGIAAIGANTVLANATASSASPTAFAMPSCSTSASALNWTTSTGFTCNAAVNAATLGGATFASPGAIGSTTAGTGKFTTLQATGAFTPSSTAGIVGTTTNDSANAGSVGEYITASGTGVSLTSGANNTVASISLTAGDWDVWGNVEFTQTGGASSTALVDSISVGSAAIGSAPNRGVSQFTTSLPQTLVPPMQRVSISTTTSVYLMAVPTFSGGTMTATGFIAARRVR